MDEHPSKKTLRELSGGNVLLGDVLNRIRFDASVLPAARFSVVVEQHHCSQHKLCFRYLWGYECHYGDRCKYMHKPELQLRVYAGLRRGVVPPGGQTPMLTIAMLEMSGLLLTAPESARDFPTHAVAYLQFDDLIVWTRDGGMHSRNLWDLFTRRRVQKIAANAASAIQDLHFDTQTTSSVIPTVCSISMLPADVWSKVMEFLPVLEEMKCITALAVNESLRPVILDRAIWAPVTRAKYLEPRQSVARFAFLTQATVHAHASLVSSVRRFGDSQDFRFAVPALKEVEDATVAHSVQVTVENRISDIAYTATLVGVACTNELHLFRVADGTGTSSALSKVAMAARPRNRAFDFVALSSHSRNSVLVHAGAAGLFVADIDEATLPIKKSLKFAASDGPPCGLEISKDGSLVAVGLERGGLRLIDTELMTDVGKVRHCESLRSFRKFDRKYVCLDAAGVSLVGAATESDQVRLFSLQGKWANCELTGALAVAGGGQDEHTTVAVGTADGFVLMLDVRKEGVVEKLQLESGTPCKHLEISSRIVTGWGEENSVVKCWDVDAFSCLGESPLSFDVSAMAHTSAPLPSTAFMLTLGVSRPRKYNRGQASILCLASHTHLWSQVRANTASPAVSKRKNSRG